MLNKKGQTLILFVILIPLLLGVAALVVDVGLMVSSQIRLKEVSKLAIQETLDENLEEEKIKEIFKNNDVTITNLKIIKEKEQVRIQNEYEIDSIFGNLLGIKKYRIKIDLLGYKKDNKMIYE